jgi:cytochrome c-type biogenesis protein
MARAARVVRLALPLAVAGVLAACGGTGKPGASAHTKPQAPLAPDYKARRMNSTQVVSLRSMRGRPVLLTSFATWCVECRSELPQIERLAERYGPGGLRVVGVSVDEGSDAGSVAFAQHFGVRFELLHDANHDYQIAFRSVGVPQSELIDRDGHVVKVWQGGFDVESSETRQLLTRVLRAKGSK